MAYRGWGWHPARMRWARAAMGLTLLALVLWKANAQSVLRSLSTLDARLFALAALLYGACQLLSSLRWGLILRAVGAPVRPRRLFALYLVGMFFNQLLPGSIGGDVVKMVALARGAAGGVSVVLDRLVGLAALLALAAAAALFGARVDPRLGVLGAAVLLAAAIAYAALRGSAGGWRLGPAAKAPAAPGARGRPGRGGRGGTNGARGSGASGRACEARASDAELPNRVSTRSASRRASFKVLLCSERCASTRWRSPPCRT